MKGNGSVKSSGRMLDLRPSSPQDGGEEALRRVRRGEVHGGATLSQLCHSLALSGALGTDGF